MVNDVNVRKRMASDIGNQSRLALIPVPMTTTPLPGNACSSPVVHSHSPLHHRAPVSPLSALPISRQPYSLEDIIGRDVAMGIFALFFDYVSSYCLLFESEFPFTPFQQVTFLRPFFVRPSLFWDED